jgi:hypothetical protein
VTTLGDPARYAVYLDGFVPSISAAALAEVDQFVAHWRAGWSDLAIGAVLASGQPSFAQRCYAVQALRRSV